MPEYKKILLAAGIFPPDIGGPATYVKILAEELPKLGFEVRVLAYSDDEAESRKLKVESNRESRIFKINRKQNIFSRYFNYFFIAWKLVAWADIVYAQDAVNSGLPIWLACKLRGKKYYLKIVGDYAWEQGTQRCGVKELLDDFQNKKYGFKVELWRKIQRLVAGNAKKIITPSNYLKNIVKQWGVDEDIIQVIYNSVKKIKAAEFNKAEIKQELNLTGDIIISVGRLVPWKGFDTLIEIFPDLLKINPNFKLIIVGEGPEYNNLKFKVTSYKLQEKVFFTGSLEQQILFQYIQASGMFVLNTGYEGLPHIIIEAMQLGIPVITTKAGGNTEVIENNKNGILVEYNNCEQLKNAIIRLHQDKGLAVGLSSRAKESVTNKFSKDRMIEKLIKIFNF
ncbi:MAG: glycosyltransferase family 4 protein [Patescibacteria group bacterium]|nr:glycosyltransferase family 4 protein [Patescibacteria group bacterium]